MIMAFLTPLLPWLALIGVALGGLFGLKLKWKSDATKAEQARVDVERKIDVVHAVTQRAEVDVSVGAASDSAVADELRKNARHV